MFLKYIKMPESKTVKRACIDCWRRWVDRDNFIRLRNQWQNLDVEEQRMLWLAAGEFGDDGSNTHEPNSEHPYSQAWKLGIERKGKFDI